MRRRVMDRLVNEYGVGYIKMDYNIEPGIGTNLMLTALVTDSSATTVHI